LSKKEKFNFASHGLRDRREIIRHGLAHFFFLKKEHTLPRPTGGHANVTNVSRLYDIMESFHLQVKGVKRGGQIEN